MGGGGIINQAKVLLTACQDPNMWDFMDEKSRALVDAVAAKFPGGPLTKKDCEDLVKALHQSVEYFSKP